MVDQTLGLQVDLAGLQLKVPLTVASGTFGPGQNFAELWLDQGLAKDRQPFSYLGALTTKGISNVPWAGNPGVRIDETASGMLNSIGLENPGVEAFCQEDLVWLASQGVPIIVNVSGHTLDEYLEVIARLEQEPAVSAYELNISCPNVDSGGMTFGVDALAAAELVSACRLATKRPLIVKLTPNVTDITEIACAAEAAGADALSLINTVAGMSIDLKSRKPVFDRVLAGLSGPAIKPIALWAVYRVYEAVDIPLIGMGGVRNASDVIEFMLAGASLVAVGSHNFTDPLAIPRIYTELVDWCEKNEISEVKSLIGALHDA
ncbi:MAG: dihydroorotate dehydrogenase [Coriobacteriia bacterium]|nr:dihydroorotate dehydrogenase [Coriobacteriia bacterium]